MPAFNNVQHVTATMQVTVPGAQASTAGRASNRAAPNNQSSRSPPSPTLRSFFQRLPRPLQRPSSKAAASPPATTTKALCWCTLQASPASGQPYKTTTTPVPQASPTKSTTTPLPSAPAQQRKASPPPRRKASAAILATTADTELQAILAGLHRAGMCLVQLTAAAGPLVQQGQDTAAGVSLGPCTSLMHLPIVQPMLPCAASPMPLFN